MHNDWNSAVVVRERDGTLVPSTGKPDNNTAPSSLTPANAITPPGVGPNRYELIQSGHPAALSGGGGGGVGNMLSVFGGPVDISGTYWTPDSTRGERGLLEAMYRRTSSNASYIMVASRPEEELARNFSTPDDRMFNVNDDRFKLSRTTRAFHAVGDVSDDVNMSGAAFKAGMRGNLPNLQQDEYFLAKYRDYSSWAVKKYYSEARRDARLVGPLYVERCFAIRVGASNGVLIPITEPQLIYGQEILLRQAMENPNLVPNDESLGCWSLNPDQFRSIGAVAEDSAFVNPKLQGEEVPGHMQEEYVAPAFWDWSPSAIQKRWQRYLDEKYRAVGQLVVRAAIIGSCLYLVSSFVGKGGSRASARANRRRRSFYDDDYFRPGLVSTVFDVPRKMAYYAFGF